MKIRKTDIGRQCLVKYDDVGRLEGMIIDVGDNHPISHQPLIEVYGFNDKTVDTVEPCQIVELGKRVVPA
jgi:hypothetical protein